MIFNRKLRVIKRSGSALSNAQLEHICSLNEYVMNTTGSQYIELERCKVKDFVSSVDSAYLIEDTINNRVLGSIFVDHIPSSKSNRTFIQIDYMLVHPSLRGSALANWMFIRIGIDILRRFYGKDIWFIAIGSYPLGFRAAWKYGGTVRHSLDPEIPTEVKAVMVDLARNQCKERWNPETECIQILTLPPNIPDKALERFKR